MKKIILLLFALFMFMLQSNAVEMKFEEAYAQSKSKPAAIFLYADWADNAQECRVQFENIQQQLGNKYNYVFLDLSNKDTKGFNKIFPIYTVPYIFTFRANGKISRYFDTDCILSNSCIISRMNAFLR